jgi:diguanylate cyclase (GGDEF)-like protein
MNPNPTRDRGPLIASLAAGLFLALAVAAADVATGYEINLGLFYLAPIAVVTWWAGRPAGIWLAVASVVGMLIVDTHVTRDIPFPSNYLIPYWNSGIRLGYFVIFVCILSALRAAYDREKASARLDFLTGVPNRQAFSESLNDAISRSRRTGAPLALAFLDCDNFKSVNDQFGHESGDELLRETAASISRRLRATDVVARIGGDEFAVLLAEARVREARVVIDEINDDLRLMALRRGWPVTYSIGIVTFLAPPADGRAALLESDRVMYAVKREGKNGVAHCVVGTPEPPGRLLS